jgi:hypothetical protein
MNQGKPDQITEFILKGMQPVQIKQTNNRT